MSTFWRQNTSFMAKWADNLHPGSVMTSRSTPEIDGGFHKISYPSVGGDWWRNTCRPWTLATNGLRRNATLLPMMWSFWWIPATHKGIDLWVEFKRFFLALTERSKLYVSEREAKIMCDQSQSCVHWRTEGIEHSPIRGRGCSRERSLINTNAVRWDGQTKHYML